MLEEKYIDNTQYEQAVLTPVTDGLQPLSTAAYHAYMDNYLKQVVEKLKQNRLQLADNRDGCLYERRSCRPATLEYLQYRYVCQLSR